MLWARVDSRIYGDNGFKLRGEVLHVGDVNFPASRSDFTEGIIVELDDPVVEQLLQSSGKLIIQWPYHNGEDEDSPDLVLSTKYFDIDALPIDLRDEILDPDVYVNPIPWAIAEPFWKDRSLV
jgi:hypothetical protein